MNKEFIPYEQALALKELGFDEPCFGYYYTLNGKDWKFAEKSEYYRLDDEINIGTKFSLLAPTFSQAFKWFIEKYEIYYTIEGSKKFGFQHFIYDEKESYEIKSEETFKHYEEAELACLNKLIQIVKEKQ